MPLISWKDGEALTSGATHSNSQAGASHFASLLSGLAQPQVSQPFSSLPLTIGATHSSSQAGGSHSAFRKCKKFLALVFAGSTQPHVSQPFTDKEIEMAGKNKF